MAAVQTTAGGMPVLILKEGTKENKGKDAQKNNLTAAKLIAEIVRTCLGPRVWIRCWSIHWEMSPLQMTAQQF